jgi:hypothetical protein
MYPMDSTRIAWGTEKYTIIGLRFLETSFQLTYFFQLWESVNMRQQRRGQEQGYILRESFRRWYRESHR